MKCIAFLTDKQNPWTLLTISNDPMVMAACDRVIVMNEGEVVLDGPFDELMKNDKFMSLVD